MPARAVFMGSPEFAVPTLEALSENYELAGVVTQPDRPAGRGRRLASPPIKGLANEFGLPVIQPRRLTEPDAMETLRTWDPELIVVSAFGQILRSEVLDLPQHGCINVHASLLPRWRGAAPIQAAILHGDSETGVTIMKMDEGVDTGPILNQRALPISPGETAGSLSPKLAQLGAELLLDTLPDYLSGELKPKPQQGEATYAPMLKKKDGELDFNQSASSLERKIRAFQPWPGTFMHWKNQRLKILAARYKIGQTPGNGSPGQHEVHADQPAVITADGLLILEEVQPAGKKPMRGSVFLRGARDWI